MILRVGKSCLFGGWEGGRGGGGSEVGVVLVLRSSSLR